MSISSLGVASGLDLEGLVSQLVSAERDPKLNLYAQRQSELNVQVSAIGAIKSVVSSFQDSVDALNDADSFGKRSANVTQPESGDVIDVSADTDATVGSFEISVDQLAQGSRAQSTAGLFTDTSDVVTASGGDLTFTAGSETFSITLDPGATLADLRTAINDSSDNAFISANIINTGSESRLILTSSETGTGNDVVVTNNNSELDNVSTVATGAGSAGMTIDADDQAQDAIITVDGITIQNASNTFEDAIQDIDITAKAESVTGETAKLDIAADTDSLNTLFDNFVSSYNTMISTMDEATAEGAVFSGDSTIRSFKSQLLRTISSDFSSISSLENIYGAGFGIDDKGKLEKSNPVTSLSDQIGSNINEIEKMFVGDNGIASTLSAFLEGYTDTNGVFEEQKEIAQEQLDSVATQRSSFLERMESYEATLRKQFGAMDSLVGSMQRQGAYISQQLSNLPGFTRQSSS